MFPCAAAEEVLLLAGTLCIGEAVVDEAVVLDSETYLLKVAVCMAQ